MRLDTNHLTQGATSYSKKNMTSIGHFGGEEEELRQDLTTELPWAYTMTNHDRSSAKT
jgi:hypothetical protein